MLTDDRPAREVLKAEWGQWLSRDWDWDWWVTLTYDMRAETGKFRPASPTHTAVGWARSEQDWDNWLASVSERAAKDAPMESPYWFRGREPNKHRYGTHFHALVGFPEGVKYAGRSVAWREWFTAHGNARIEPYDPSRGAGFYVAKYVTKELGDLQFSPNAGQYRKDIADGSRHQYTSGDTYDRQRQQAERGNAEAAARSVHPWRVPRVAGGTDLHSSGHD